MKQFNGIWSYSLSFFFLKFPSASFVCLTQKARSVEYLSANRISSSRVNGSCLTHPSPDMSLCVAARHTAKKSKRKMWVYSLANHFQVPKWSRSDKKIYWSTFIQLSARIFADLRHFDTLPTASFVPELLQPFGFPQKLKPGGWLYAEKTNQTVWSTLCSFMWLDVHSKFALLQHRHIAQTSLNA